jgi:hypothetical protein
VIASQRPPRSLSTDAIGDRFVSSFRAVIFALIDCAVASADRSSAIGTRIG